jgi:hypothetical protein
MKFPLRLEKGTKKYEYTLYSADGDIVAEQASGEDAIAPEPEEAEEIVRRCNMYDELLSALVEADQYLAFDSTSPKTTALMKKLKIYDPPTPKS